MIFRQLFDSVSGTYSYLLASRHRRRGADHRSGAGEGRSLSARRARARPAAGQGGRHPSACRPHHRARRAARPHPLHHRDGRADQGRRGLDAARPKATSSRIEGVSLDVLYTPGHTDDSYSFVMGDRVFTGDTLLIRGTGRTDFQNGDPRMQYESLFGKLLRLPDETLVYPGARLQGRDGLHHRRGEALQPAPAGEVDRRICRADEQPQAAEPEDDGRRGAGQHACRAAAAGYRQARLVDRSRHRAIALIGQPQTSR